MATYDSQLTGIQVDNAIDAVLNDSAEATYGHIKGNVTDNTAIKAALTDVKEDKANVVSKGSATVPVYMDGSGVATPITSYAGTAARATADASGANIVDTYAKRRVLKDLTNVNRAGENELIKADRVWTNYTGILDDAEGKADVEAMKRSTFRGYTTDETVATEKNLFYAVVPEEGRTLSITDDGIASGFSGSNRIYSSQSLNLANYNNWVIKCKSTVSSGNNICVFELIKNIDFYTASNHLLRVQKNSSNVLLVLDKGLYGSVSTSNINITLNENIYYIFELTYSYNIGYSLKIYDTSDVLLGQTTFPNFKTNVGNDAFVSFGFTNLGVLNANGQIDLSQFSITVDGLEVFNGNKTGIDQIKKDDYELKNQVGTVVVDEDRIASGFGGSWDNKGFVKGVTIPATTVTKNIKYTMRLKTPSETPTDLWTIFGINACWYLYMKADGRLSLAFPNTYFGDTWDNCYSSIVELNTWYDIECGQYIDKNNTVQSYLKWKKSSDNNFEISYAHTSLVTKLFHTSSSSYLVMGAYEYGGLPFIGGSIDLNYTKLIIDDKLVYQPTLRIPYYKTATGCKVVDAAYRDRVEDAAEQYGYANYYTKLSGEQYHVTKVGSPTLSGGIASGFSGSTYGNHLKLPSDIRIYGNTWEISMKLNVDGNTGGTILVQEVSDGFASSKINFTAWNDNKIYLQLGNGSQTQDCNGTDTHSGIVYTKIGRKNNKYYLKTSNDGIIYKEENSVDVIYEVDIKELSIGSSNSDYFGGSIDLSQFIISVDGKEVYRAYENNTYTLPKGENLNGHKAIVAYTDTYRADTDLNLEQVGTCTANTAVTFPKAFKDANYSLTCPYTNKTATGFTPTQTGDYIAIGKVTLDELYKQ